METHRLVLPGDLNHYGFLFGGRLLAWIGAPEEIYMNCIRHALHSFSRGEAPMICVEFARRNVPPERRPGLVETEKYCKESGKSGG